MKAPSLGRADLRESAFASSQSPAAERIVPASIENDEIKLGPGPLHLSEDQCHVDHLEVDIGFLHGIGGNRHEIIRSANLNAVSGIIEQRDVSAGQRVAEGLDRLVKAGLVEVELDAIADQREACVSQRLGDQGRIVLGD